MKKLLLSISVLVWAWAGNGQITSPAINANFGVDADLRANFYNSFLTAGNDDWFANGEAGPGAFIIDTTGAAYIRNLYNTTPSTRMSPFFRSMRFPQFSIVNGMMLIDGIFIRDHHGDDSTVFASGSNKNGMSPASWSCPVSQGIPDKNDILDMFMHVRRAGANGTDPLWMFGGLSLDNTTGNRYFDFEMYQTDIVYDRPTLSFKGYGPDAGHTSWEFDASGNVLKAGDIIFSAEYSSSSLSNVEARIWVHQSTLSVTPVAFNWGGSFDGASPSAVYGYASIQPKTAGDYYTGLQCSNNTWGGPFGIVLQDNSLATNYSAKQFMEFSVNLSKLGLDPLVNVGDPCLMPFRRILVKSRASTSFTAELKDFVGPFSFFRAPKLAATPDVPYFCGAPETRTISVAEPLSTSLYTWTTIDGNIVGSNIGPEIEVDQPGSYVVSQELMDSCGSTFARDTLTLLLNPACVVLNAGFLSFNGDRNESGTVLNWHVANNKDVLYFQVEKSTDNINFSSIGKIHSNGLTGDANYQHQDLNSGPGTIFYRIKIVQRNGSVRYSKVIALTSDKNQKPGFSVLPNPVNTQYNILVRSDRVSNANISIIDIAGRVVEKSSQTVSKGLTQISMTKPQNRPAGSYWIQVQIGTNVFVEKVIFLR